MIVGCDDGLLKIMKAESSSQNIVNALIDQDERNLDCRIFFYDS